MIRDNRLFDAVAGLRLNIRGFPKCRQKSGTVSPTPSDLIMNVIQTDYFRRIRRSIKVDLNGFTDIHRQLRFVSRFGEDAQAQSTRGVAPRWIVFNEKI